MAFPFGVKGGGAFLAADRAGGDGVSPSPVAIGAQPTGFFLGDGVGF